MSTLFRPKITVGLYRHFKGGYYYVTGLSKSATDESTIMVNYFDVCHPEYGSFVRPLEDFNADCDGGHFMSDTEIKYIKDRADNVTGQTFRFEKIKDLNFQLGSVSTEQLVRELRSRTDSPIHELDIEELQSKIFSKDYVVGESYFKTPETPQGVYTISVHDTPEQAREYMSSHAVRQGTRVFKRVFIEV